MAFTACLCVRTFTPDQSDGDPGELIKMKEKLNEGMSERQRERENVVIRVFIWVDGVCKSCPGRAPGASVERPGDQSCE